MSKKNVVGIDLGTSFTSIARLDQYGRPEVLPNAEGEQMTPSIVYFSDEGVIVGNEAAKSGSDDPERMIENAKRHLGAGFLGWEIDEVFYTPVDISAYILGKLKRDAEDQIGHIDGAVLSVPVHFNIQQRELTITAAKYAGLEVLGLVNEPVAAGLTFILGDNGLAYASLADEQTILVYDLGGGTFDLSIVHYCEEGIDVKAATGDMKLGGIDWNARLIDIIAQSFWDKRGYDIRRDPRMMRKLGENIESAKRSLSNPNKPWTNVTMRYEGYNESFKITRQEFETATQDLVARTAKLTEELVKTSVGRWDFIQQVVPVGGSTRMPMIREAIRKMCLKTMGEVFGLEPNYRLSPDLAIAQGAALYAGLLAGGGPDGTKWVQQTRLPKMVSARGLGLAVRDSNGDRVNHMLIPANTSLPAMVSVGVETIKPNQERISLKVVEAESEQFREEDVLLRCEIANLPEDLPEGSAFDIELNYEPSGLLKVVAKHRDTGRIATAQLNREAALPGTVEVPAKVPAKEETPAVVAMEQAAAPDAPTRDELLEVVESDAAGPDAGAGQSQLEPAGKLTELAIPAMDGVPDLFGDSSSSPTGPAASEPFDLPVLDQAAESALESTGSHLVSAEAPAPVLNEPVSDVPVFGKLGEDLGFEGDPPAPAAEAARTGSADLASSSPVSEFVPSAPAPAGSDLLESNHPENELADSAIVNDPESAIVDDLESQPELVAAKRTDSRAAVVEERPVPDAPEQEVPEPEELEPIVLELFEDEPQEIDAVVEEPIALDVVEEFEPIEADDEEETRPPPRKSNAATVFDDDDDEARRRKSKAPIVADKDHIPRRRPKPTEDDEDDSPRRRPKPAVADDEDDSPRRRPKPAAADDEDDSPRRRPKPAVADDEDDSSRRRPKPPVDDDDDDDSPRRMPDREPPRRRDEPAPRRREDPPPRKKGR